MTIPFIGLITYLLFVYFEPNVFFPILATIRAPLIIILLTAIITVINGGRPIKSRQTILLILIIVIGVVSVLTSPIPNFTFPGDLGTTYEANLSDLKHLFQWAAMFFLFTMICGDKRNIGRLYYILLLYASVIGIASLTADWIGAVPLKGGVATLDYERLTNFFGGFGNTTNEFAAFMLFMFPLPLCMIQDEKSFVKKIIFTILSLIFVACVIKTQSRGAFVGLVFVLLIIIWNFRKKIGLLILVFIIVLYAGINSSYEYRERVSSLRYEEVKEGKTGRGRIIQYKYSAELIKSYPFTGTGIGTFKLGKIYLLGLNPYTNDARQDTHNAFLELAAEIGLPALILYFFLILFSLRDIKFAENVFKSRKDFEKLSGMISGIKIGFYGFLISILFLSEQYNLILAQCFAFSVISKMIAERSIITTAESTLNFKE
ncbi:MAG: hypothetical protein GTO02_18120 [Candidatus Dadabacteria bacterium]|nr:hypothetical protein [Candidatus Dadabacteria bacterium]